MSTTPFDLDHFQHRIVREAMKEATAAYWTKRADQYAAAMPRASDHIGRRSYDDVAARAIRLQTIVTACRNRATLCELSPDEEQLIRVEIERCNAIAWYMVDADDATHIEQVRTIWRAADQDGFLDIQLARHLERQAKRIQRETSAIPLRKAA